MKQRKLSNDQLSSIPEITHLTMSAITQNCTYGLDNMVRGLHGSRPPRSLIFMIYNFWKEDFSLRENQGLHEAIVNETFLKKQGIAEPLGKTFQIWDETYTTVGVVADYPRDKLTREITPLFIRFSDTGSDRHIIRINPVPEK